MHVYIVFAHPSRRSFTGDVLAEFCRGLEDGDHSYQIGDLYEMDFRTDMSLDEYNREMNVYGNRPDLPVLPDVQAEHAKIEKADGLVCIFPVWWSDCPAKLKGWFDRVCVCGYTYLYENETYPLSKLEIDRALVLCTAGHTHEHLEETGILESMRCIYLNDRLRPEIGVAQTDMVVLGGMAEGGESVRHKNLARAYRLGKDFC
ncbi:MAG: NAD(P)H-dependent oxidoreductase [Gemmatimonadetes bacterium]|nr:NAD(P)H-dependent oxidoreductase [Gemmatimonadota bacterium]